MLEEPREVQIFRHFVVLLPYAVVFELVMLYGGYLMFRDPGWRSPKGVGIILVWIGANLVLADLISKVWRTRSTFAVWSSHLVVSDPIRRTTDYEVPWVAVISVERIPQYWWNRGGGIRLNEIVLENGRRILFGTHLSGYSRFVESLRRLAVNCKSFDPYAVGIGERVGA